MQGVGLGLYINKLIVEKFDGDVGVTSKLNEGSTFSFSFQLERMHANTKSLHRIMNPSVPEIYL